MPEISCRGFTVSGLEHFSASWGIRRPAGRWSTHVDRWFSSSPTLEDMHVKLCGVASGTLAAALPGGVRDAGVRAVDRAEAGLRRWALFIGGAAFLFRVLLWH